VKEELCPTVWKKSAICADESFGIWRERWKFRCCPQIAINHDFCHLESKGRLMDCKLIGVITETSYWTLNKFNLSLSLHPLNKMLWFTQPINAKWKRLGKNSVFILCTLLRKINNNKNEDGLRTFGCIQYHKPYNHGTNCKYKKKSN
jgi:hypothetical protein